MSGAPPARSARAPGASAPRRGPLRLLRLVGAKLRDLAIGLALLSAVSFVPVSVTADWPEHAQQAMAIAREVRSLLLEVGADVARGARAWVSDAGATLVDDGGALIAEGLDRAGDLDLGTGLADLSRGWSHPVTWIGDLIGDGLSALGDALLGDWWPRPTLPAGGGDLPQVAGSFAAAKDLLYERVQRGQRVTAYCGCRYNGRREVDLESCGLEE